MELQEQLAQAVTALHNGSLIAYPTEGVYGIGCDPMNTEALQQVVEIKQRDAAKGLILVTGDFAQLQDFIEPMNHQSEAKMLASWPGPVTWIVAAKPHLPAILTGGRSTLAVRVSAHPVIKKLTASFGQPIVSTSANHTGKPPATSAAAVKSTLGEKIDVIVDAPVGSQQGATPIFDAASGEQIR